MLPCWSEHVDNLDIRVREEFSIIGVPSRNTVLPSESTNVILASRTDCDDFASFDEFHLSGVREPGHSCTDQSKSDFSVLHGVAPRGVHTVCSATFLIRRTPRLLNASCGRSLPR